MKKEELYTALEDIIGSEVNDNTDLSNWLSGPNSTPLLELLSDDEWFESLWSREEYLACCATAYQLYDLIQASAQDTVQLHLHALRLSLVNKPSFFFEAVTPLVYPDLDVSCVDWPAVSEETAWTYKAANQLAVLLNNAGLIVPLHLYKTKPTVGDVYQTLHEYTCTHTEAWQEIKSFSTSSSFEQIRTKNRVYIDKSKLFKGRLAEDSVLFLARPRRFGKSVLLDMLLRLYSGESHLFEGTALESKAQNMPACHVVRMSWASILTANTTNPELTLKSKLIKILVNSLTSGAGNDLAQAQFKEKHQKLLEDARSLSKQSEISDADFTDAVSLLLEKCYDSSRPFVLLIDEYDAPANAFLDDSEQLKVIMSLYQQFFSLIKDSTSCFECVFITGISKFSDNGLFSGFNLVDDLSEDPASYSLVGFTQQDLYTGYFLHLVYIAQVIALRYVSLFQSKSNAYVQQDWLKEWLSHADKCSPLTLLLAQLKRYYDGYNFYPDDDENKRVYNPWSIVKFIKFHERLNGQYGPNITIFTNFWVESGSFTNSFFVHKMQSMATKSYEVRWKLLGLLSDLLHSGPYKISLKAVNRSPHLYTDEQCVEFGASFLYRAGYLTWHDSEHLCIPNLEVRNALDDLFKDSIKNYLARSDAQPRITDSDLLDVGGAADKATVLNLGNLKRFFNDTLLCFSSSYLSKVGEHFTRDIISVALKNSPYLHKVSVVKEAQEAGGRATLVIKVAHTEPPQIHSIEFKQVRSKSAVKQEVLKAKDQILSQGSPEQYPDCEVFQYIAVFYNAAANTAGQRSGAVKAYNITCEQLEPVGYHEKEGKSAAATTSSSSADSDSH